MAPASELIANSSYDAAAVATVASNKPFWQQTMLRVSDPVASIEHYTTHYGFTLVDKYDFPQWSFTVYFLATLEEGQAGPDGEPGSDAAHSWLFSTNVTTLELTHNHGSEENGPQPGLYHSGNIEPNRGFGHIAVFVDDVYAKCAELEAAGVQFQKKPDGGRMKGLAFALDPDGYWIEIIKRAEDAPSAGKGLVNLSQTMIRVKDPAASLAFYGHVFGMQLIAEKHFPDAAFSLYFLAHLSDAELARLPADLDPSSQAAFDFMKTLWSPVLELTWNHGTESDADFTYQPGDASKYAFGHTGFIVDDLVATCDALDAAGVPFAKRPQDGQMKTIAFVVDPDGYKVELIQRGSIAE